jgi:6-phosphogluconolactonase
MTLHEFADPSAWLEAMVARWETLGGSALQARGSFSVSLSGGSTPKPLYEHLAKLKWPWSATHLYLGDERWVPPDHKDSNYRMIHEAFHATGAKIERVHTEIATAEVGARDYEKRLKAELGDPPKFDLILLGVGDDGHTSSLFHGPKALKLPSPPLCPGHLVRDPRSFEGAVHPGVGPRRPYRRFPRREGSE